MADILRLSRLQGDTVNTDTRDSKHLNNVFGERTASVSSVRDERTPSAEGLLLRTQVGTRFRKNCQRMPSQGSIFAKYLELNKEADRVAQETAESARISQTFTYQYAKSSGGYKPLPQPVSEFQSQKRISGFDFRELQEHAAILEDKVKQNSQKSTQRNNRTENLFAEQTKTEIRRRFGKRKIEGNQFDSGQIRTALDGSISLGLLQSNSKSHRQGIVGQLSNSPLKCKPASKLDLEMRKSSGTAQVDSSAAQDQEGVTADQKAVNNTSSHRSPSSQPVGQADKSTNKSISRYVQLQNESIIRDSDLKLKAIKQTEQKRMNSLSSQRSKLSKSSRMLEQRKSSETVGHQSVVSKLGFSQELRKSSLSKNSSKKAILDSGLMNRKKTVNTRTASPSRVTLDSGLADNLTATNNFERDAARIKSSHLESGRPVPTNNQPKNGTDGPTIKIATSKSVRQLLQEIPQLSTMKRTATIAFDRKPAPFERKFSTANIKQPSSQAKPIRKSLEEGELWRRVIEKQPKLMRTDSERNCNLNLPDSLDDLHLRVHLTQDSPVSKPVEKTGQTKGPNHMQPSKHTATSLGNINKMMEFLESDRQLSSSKGKFRDRMKQFRKEMNADNENLMLDSGDHPYLEHFRVVRKLGDGSSASVLLVIDSRTGKRYALKVCDKGTTHAQSRSADVQGPSPANLRPHEREVGILACLTHQNVIKMHDHFEGRLKFYILLEYLGPHTLAAHLDNKKIEKNRMDEDEAAHVFHEIGQALKNLHALNIAHRDLKIHNVIMGAKGEVKLIDFGYAIKCALGELTNTFCGTPTYMPPEVISRQPYDGTKSDIWSFGICLYRTICGKFPFTGVSQTNLFYVIKKGQFEIPDYVSDKAAGLIRWALKPDPKERPSILQILQHPWFSGVAFESTTAD